MATSDLVVAVNPAAGSGRARSVLETLRAAVPELAAATFVSPADAASTARELDAALAAAAPAAGPAGPRLVVIGGDGTFHTVANALLGRGVPPPRVGLVPAGTGSDFARCLKLPREPIAALRHLLAAPGRPLDALRLTTAAGVRWSLNVASAGISGVVDAAVNALPHRGRTAFVSATLRALWRYRALQLRVEVDGQPFYEGGVFLLAIANGTSFGKGMRVAPHALVDDGLAEVVLIPELSGFEVAVRMPQIFLGTHLRLERVRYQRARHVRFSVLGGETDNGNAPPMDVDGEVLPASAAEIEVVPGALTFLG